MPATSVLSVETLPGIARGPVGHANRAGISSLLVMLSRHGFAARTAEHAKVGDGQAAALIAQRQQPPARQALQPPHHLGMQPVSACYNHCSVHVT